MGTMYSTMATKTHSATNNTAAAWSVSVGTTRSGRHARRTSTACAIAVVVGSSQWGFSQTTTMSLACLVCHGMSSPSHSLRSYSVSSSEEESRCGAAVACLARRVTPAGTSSVGTSKVTPFPPMVSGQVGTEGTPRLQRSRAVSRDLVRDWNFDEVIVAN
ncbi:unnamed protein product [Miscanthus lutarioriparius]|uniref:Uncharacterized protein n=1 Tax=Miscanthus lutarioriparius TaxID=422564 RepID=A0A811RNF1_9POAL|nr:unnamed protein product [Miscanthus lutarioriparius]